jgi:hypothetical protein
MTVARYRRAARRLALALMVLGAPGAVAQRSAGIPGVISPGVEPEIGRKHPVMPLIRPA